MADEFNQQLNAVLNDPDTMQKIMSLAQNLSGTKQDSSPKSQPSQKDNDFSALQNISKIAATGSIDQQQQNLLSALSPYLSGEKIRKLENAMRAARMTKIATAFLNSQRHSNGR